MPWLLNLLYAIVLMFASPWLLYRALSTGRYREGWSQKLLGLLPATLLAHIEGKPVVWLHGVSVGEIQLLKPVVEQLKQANPTMCFVVSTTTESGMELAKKLFPAESLFYLPFDFTWPVRRVMGQLKPTAIVLGELELWPNLIHFAAKQKIPIAVVNARLSARSFQGYQRFRWITRGMFSQLGLIAAQDTTYAERFLRCGVPAERIQVTGSTKFDNVTFDRHCAQVQQLRTLVGINDSHIVWIVGSTQSPEELVAVEAFLSLRNKYPSLRLIVVPRHPDRFEAVFQELQGAGAEPMRRSQVASNVSAEDWSVLLVDTVGELRWWWGLADIAIVGGSFGTRGGQNMIEPAAYGANVAFGPNTSNFRDICDILLAGGGAERINGLDELPAWVNAQLENPEPGRERGRTAQKLVKKHQGALARTIEALQVMLDQRRSEPN